MTDDDGSVAIARWRAQCERAVFTCTSAMQRRMPYWVATGARVWADPARAHSRVGTRRVDAIVDVAVDEVRLREAYVQRLLLHLLVRRGAVSPSLVLADLSRMASQLLAAGCRDIIHDLENMGRFERGVDVDRVTGELSDAVGRITVVLMDAVNQGVR